MMVTRADNYQFGLDADIKNKFAAKYDPEKERLVSVWIGQLTGKAMTGNLQNDLKSGILLCQALNKISPGTVSGIGSANQPFVHRENITAYLNGCKRLGMKQTDLFVTQDLYEGDNMVVVIDQILNLSVLAKTIRTFSGPYITISGGQLSTHGASASAAPQVNPVEAKASAAGPAPARPVASTPAKAAPAASPPAASGGAGKFCSGCGKARVGAAKFCGDCGAAF